MPEVGCPKCGLPVRTTIAHCKPSSTGSCWWGFHPCGALVNTLRPSQWIDYPPRSTT